MAFMSSLPTATATVSSSGIVAALPDPNHSSSSSSSSDLDVNVVVSAATAVRRSMCSTSSTSTTTTSSSTPSAEATVSSADALRPPPPPTRYETNPPTFHPPARFSAYTYEDEYPPCTHCLNPSSLILDRSAGDVVCTNCGVVAQQHYCDTSAEWREFNEVEDIIKGKPSASRCGMACVDESLYVGGLQPTTFTSAPFGGMSASSRDAAAGGGGGVVASKEAMIRRRLCKMNQKIDKMMEKQYEEKMREAKVARDILKKRRDKRKLQNINVKQELTEEEEEEEEENEYTQLLQAQEENNPSSIIAPSSSEKWSIQRAYLLCSSVDSYMQRYHHPSYSDDSYSALYQQITQEKESLEKKMDKSSLAASRSLHKALQTVQSCITSLSLPELVVREVEGMLCRYAMLKNGLVVKGVSSSSSSSSSSQKEERKYEKNWIMSSSLCAALLYLSCKKLGWGRTLLQVCNCFQEDENVDKRNKKKLVVKPKHVCRAMNEVKSSFPDFVASATSSSSSKPTATTSSSTATTTNTHVTTKPTKDTTTLNQTFHTLKTLSLPSTPRHFITLLLLKSLQEQKSQGVASGVKVNVILGGLVYLVCSAGQVLETLAKQALESSSSTGVVVRNKEEGKKRWMRPAGEGRNSKRAKLCKTEEDGDYRCTSLFSCNSANVKKGTSKEEEEEELLPPPLSRANIDQEDHDCNITSAFSSSATSSSFSTTTFDALLHEPIVEKCPSPTTTSQHEEEEEEQDELHSWEIWKKKSTSSSSSWYRPISTIAKATHVSKTVLMEHYRKHVFPRRSELLTYLGEYKKEKGDINVHVEEEEKEEEEQEEERRLVRKSMVAAVPLMTLPSTNKR